MIFSYIVSENRTRTTTIRTLEMSSAMYVIRQSRLQTPHTLPSLSALNERIATKRSLAEFLKTENPDQGELIHVLAQLDVGTVYKQSKVSRNNKESRRFRGSKRVCGSRSMNDEESLRAEITSKFDTVSTTVLKILQEESSRIVHNTPGEIPFLSLE